MGEVRDPKRFMRLLGQLPAHAAKDRHDRARRIEITNTTNQVLVMPLAANHRLYVKSPGETGTGHIGKFQEIATSKYIGKMVIVRSIFFANEAAGHRDWQKEANDMLLIRPFDLHARNIESRIAIIAPVNDIVHPDAQGIHPRFESMPRTPSAPGYFLTRDIMGAWTGGGRGMPSGQIGSY